MEENTSFDPRTGLAQPVVDMLQPNPFVDSLPAPARIKAYNAPWVNGGGSGSYSLNGSLSSAEATLHALANYQPVNVFGAKKGNYQPFGTKYTNFDRYYSHPKFSTLGFSPLRDNEAIYNANSTTLDDMSRMSGQFSKLFGIGFTSVAKSIGSTFSGKPLESDYLEAQTYSDAVRIGNSTRGGFGGFTNNLLLNSGYTFGLISEMALEELALAGLTAATGGGAGGLAALRTATNVGRFYERMKGLATTLKGIDNARSFFSAAKTAGVNAAKFINPFENTVNAVKAINAADNMSDYAKIATGFGGFYRDVRAAHATIAESKLEGTMAELDQRESLIREYQEKNNGQTPIGKELQDIYETAAKSGFTTTMANLPTIYLTNKITFDGMFKGFTPVKGAKGFSLFNPYIAFDKAAMKDAFKVVKPSLQNTFKAIKNPSMYGRAALGYTARNLSEGVQETLQESISASAKDYYGAIYRDPLLAASGDTNWDLVGNKVKNNIWGQLTTAQGLETFMSGFLMGGVVGPVSKAGSYIAQRFTMSAEEIKAQNEAKLNTLNGQVTSLNEVYNDPQKYFSLNHENLIVQHNATQGMAAAEANNDRKLFQDLKDVSLYHHLYTSLQSGQFDNIVKHLGDLKGLTPEEFKEAYGEETTQVGVEKLDELIGRAKVFKQTYDAVREHVGENPNNPALFKKGTNEYNNSVISYIAWEDSVKKLVFQRATLDRTLERILSTEELVKKNAGVSKAGASEFTALFDLAATNAELNILRTEITSSEVQEQLSDEQKETLKFKKEKLKALEAYKKAVEAFDARLNNVVASAKGANLKTLDDETDDVVGQREEEALKEAYYNYLSVISRGETVGQDGDFETSFNTLMDTFMLRRDRDMLTRSLTRAFAPERLQEEVRLNAEERLNLWANRAQALSERLAGLEAKKDQSAYLESIASIGLVPDENEYEKFVRTGELPKVFWDLDGVEVDGENPLLKSINDKYKEGNFAQYVKTEKAKAEAVNKENVTAEERQAAEAKVEKKKAAAKNIQLTPYSQSVLKAYFSRKYPNGEVDYVDFLGSEQGVNIIESLVKLEEIHSSSRSELPLSQFTLQKIGESKTKNYEKLGLIVEDFMVDAASKPKTFRKENLAAQQSLVTPKGIKGLFIVREEVQGEEETETEEVFYYTDILGKRYGDVEFATEQEARDNFEDAADLFAAEQAQSKKFVINGYAFTAGETVHIRYGAGNAKTFTVETSAKDVASAALNKRKPTLQLRDVETGNVTTVLDPSTVLPGPYNPDARPADRAYMYDVNDFSKAYGHRVADQTSKEAAKTLSDLINSTDAKTILSGATIRITANQRIASEYSIDGKTNPYISKLGEPYNIEIVYQGEVIAHIPQISSLQFTDFEGNIISPDQISFALFTEIFDVQGNPFQSYKLFRESMDNSLQIVSNVGKLLGESNSVEMSYSEFEKAVGRLVPTPGSYEFAASPSEYPALVDFQYQTIGGGVYIIDRGISRDENGNIQYNETVSTTLTGQDKEAVDARVEQAKKTDKTYPTSGRYVLAFELPNGEVRFTGIVAPVADAQTAATLIDTLNNASEETATAAAEEVLPENYNDVINSEIQDLVYHAHKSGEYSRYIVDSFGNIVVQLDNNPSFNNPVSIPVYPAGTKIESVDQLLSKTVESIIDAVADGVKFADKYILTRFNKETIRTSLPTTVDPNDLESYNLVTTVVSVGAGRTFMVNARKSEAAKSAAQTKQSKPVSGAPAFGVSQQKTKPVADQPTQQTTGVKKGVSELFESNPELAAIGTQQQYSAYLDTIFPDSKVKDIVYHGGWIDKNDNFKIGESSNGEFGAGIYFTPSFESAQEYLSISGDAPNIIAATINIKNPVVFDDKKPKKGESKDYVNSKLEENPNNDGAVYTSNRLIGNEYGVDEKLNNEIKVNSNEQVHVLGSNQDIEGFKNFVNKPTQQKTEAEVRKSRSEALSQMSQATPSVEAAAFGVATPNPAAQAFSVAAEREQLESEKNKLVVQITNEIKNAQGIPVSQARKLANQDARVVDMVNRIAAIDSKYSAKKVIGDLTTADVEDIDAFIDWTRANLPAFISVNVTERLRENLLSGSITVGQFTATLKAIAGNTKVVGGTISVGAQTPFKYHEAFHSVFRLLLSEKEISNLLSVARYELVQKLKSEGKTLNQALTELKNSDVEFYSQLSTKELEERLYEEYLADKFDSFKMNQSTPVAPSQKNFFEMLIELIRTAVNKISSFIAGRPSSSTIDSLFKAIDSGKYSSVDIQDNRFTGDYIGSIPSSTALKSIKTGAKMLVPNPNATNDSNALMPVERYLRGDLAERIIASISATYHERLQTDDLTKLTPDQVFDQVLDDFSEWYNPSREEYEEDVNLPLYERELMDIYNVLTEESGRELLKQGSKEYLSLLSYTEDIDDQEQNEGVKSSTEARKEHDEVGGFSSLPTFARTLIATSTILDKQDEANLQLNEYGAPIPYSQINNRPIYRTVDVSKVYNRLLVSLSGKRSQMESLNALALISQEDSETASFVKAFFEKAGVTVNPETLEIDVNNIERPELVVAFTKAFETVRQEADFYGFNPYKKTIRIINSTAQNDVNIQFKTWKDQFDAYSLANRNFKSNASGILNDLKNYISTGNANPVELASKLSKVLGIDIAPAYLEYSHALAKKELDRNNREQLLVNVHAGVEGLTLDTLKFIGDDIAKDVNPFNRTFEDSADLEEVENEDSTTGTGARIYKLALFNAVFDERLFSKSRRSAENKEIYSFVSPTYVKKRFMELGVSETRARLLADTFHKHNHLLNDPRFLELLAVETPHIVGDFKLESHYVDKDGKVTQSKNATLTRNTDAKSFKNFTAVDYAFANMANYTQVVERVYNKRKYYTSATNLGVLSESNHSYTFQTPIIKSIVMKNGKMMLTKTAYNKYLSILNAEYDRIAQVVNGELVDDIYNFNNGKMRGADFTKSKDFTSDEVREQLMEAILAGTSFEEAVKGLENSISQSILADINTDVEMTLEWLSDNGFLTKEKGSYKSSQGLPKAFAAQKNTPKETLEALNFLPNNIKFNLAQFMVSDFLNTSALSTLMQGDAARSFKNFVDEVKRKKAQNASGVSAAYDIPAPKLGINKVHTGVDLVVFEDPTYRAIFSKKENKDIEEKEQADAQMYSTVNTLRHMLYGFGILKDKRIADILTKIEKGERLSIEEVFGPHGTIAYNAQTNSLKVVHSYEGKYIKTSMIVLTPRMTSVDNTTPIPGREELHNLRLALESREKEGKLAAAVPVSAAKGEKINVAGSVNDIFQTNELGEVSAVSDYFTEHPMMGWTLQQVNPSNKLSGTDPSQSKQSIVSDLNPLAKAFFNGKFQSLGSLVETYKELTGQRVTLKMQNKLKSLYNSETGALDMTDFSNYAQRLVAQRSGDSETIEMFSVDENGQFIYDLNNAVTIDTYENMLMNYLSKDTLAEKVPLHSLTLVSNYGIKAVKKLLEVDENGQPKRWEVVRTEEVRRNASKYANAVRFSDAEARTFEGLGKALASGQDVYYIDDLRHAVPEYNEAGEIVGYFSEAIVPAHFAQIEMYLARNPNARIPDVIAKMFAVRIPTQDKHSNVNVRVVDFLDAHYGSVIVAPHELIEISGADFDVDKLYAAYKQWYFENGQFFEYGESDKEEDMYKDYLHYMLANDKKVREKLELSVDNELSGATATAINSVAWDVEYNEAKVVKALKELGRPATLKEYVDAVKENKGYDIYEAPYNNKLVDVKMALSWNEDTVSDKSTEGLSITEQPKAFQVAHVDPFTAVAEDSIFAEFFKDIDMNPDKFIAKILAFDDIRTGSKLIGYASRAMSSWFVGSELNAEFPEALAYDQGQYQSFAESMTNDGFRKAYIISAAVSMVTDNAKEKLAGKLQINKQNFIYSLMMISAGMSAKEALLVLQQPISRKLFKELAKKDNSFLFSPSKGLSERLASFIDPKGVSVSSLLEKYGEAVPTLTQDLLVSNMQEEDNAINLAVARLILQLDGYQSKFMNIAQVTNLVRGYENNKFLDLDETDESLENNFVGEEKFRKDKMYGALLSAHEEIKKVTSELAVTRFSGFTESLKKIAAGFEVNRRVKNKFDESLPKELLSYLNILAYKNYLMRSGKYRNLNTLTNDLVYGDGDTNIASIVQNLKQQFPDNYFLNKHVIIVSSTDPKNKYGVSYIENTSYTKLSKIEKQRVKNSVIELYSKRPDAVIDLFNYTLVKDGGLFAGGSIIDLLPLFIKQDFFDASKGLLDLFKNIDEYNDSDQIAVLGITFQDAMREFAKNYTANSQFISSPKSYLVSVSSQGPLTKASEGAITIDLFSGIRDTEDYTTSVMEEFFNEDTGKTEWLPSGMVLKATKSREKLNSEEKEKLFENIRTAQRDYGFIREEVDGQGYYTAPYYIRIGDEAYKLVGDNQPQDPEGNSYLGTVRPTGFKFTYSPIKNGWGSLKTTKIGFVFGNNPVASKTSKGTEGDVVSQAVVKNVQAKLNEAGIGVMPNDRGMIIYFDKATGENITQYNGMSPDKVVESLDSRKEESYEEVLPSSIDKPAPATETKAPAFGVASPAPASKAPVNAFGVASINPKFVTLSRDLAKLGKGATPESLKAEYDRYSQNGANSVDDFIDFKLNCL